MGTNCKIGEDCLKLFFSINNAAELHLKCLDMKDENLGGYNLGNVQ